MRAGYPAFATALAAILAAGATAPRADVPEPLQGDARVVASPAALSDPGASAGFFVLLSDTPGVLLLFTDDGALMALAGDDARRFGPWRRDPDSGRPLHPDAAEGSRCPSGVEAACWRPGDRVPYSAEVADAFGATLPPIPNTVPTPTADWTATTAIPLVPLIRDPDDRFHSASSSVLSDEQEALLGCGAFWGTDCSQDGIDLRGADASVLLQSWFGTEGTYSVSYFEAGFTGWSYGNGLAQPGTTGFQAIPVGQCSGATQLSIPCSSTRGGYRPIGGFGDSAGQTFKSEMAALSFNMQTLLVAFSVAEQLPADPIEGSTLRPEDPFSRIPSQCSFAQPQFCASVNAFYSLAAFLRPSDDDPASARTRWIWESGAEYQIVDASGDLSEYQGGRVHVLGVERSRTRAARIGVPIALFPAPGKKLAPETRFAARAPSDASETSFGLAYLTAPEPSDAALAVAALMMIATLARNRRAR